VDLLSLEAMLDGVEEVYRGVGSER
jgi:hypothetical protein